MSASVLPTPLMNRMLFVAEERQACMAQLLVQNAKAFDEGRKARRRPSDMVKTSSDSDTTRLVT